MHPESYIPILLLLLVANGSPVLAARLLGQRCSTPIDLGRKGYDGYPLLGPGKTWRGIAASLLLTSFMAWPVGLGWSRGLLFAALAMLGDLLASFTKRRLGLSPSSKATGLDQVPESLLPLLALGPQFPLTPLDILILLLVFLIVEKAFSVLLFRLGVRKRPY